MTMLANSVSSHNPTAQNSDNFPEPKRKNGNNWLDAACGSLRWILCGLRPTVQAGLWNVHDRAWSRTHRSM